MRAAIVASVVATIGITMYAAMDAIEAHNSASAMMYHLCTSNDTMSKGVDCGKVFTDFDAGAIWGQALLLALLAVGLVWLFYGIAYAAYRWIIAGKKEVTND